MAGGTAVPRHRRDGLTGRDGADALLGARPLDQDFVRLERAGRVEDAVGCTPNPFDGAGDADEALCLVVIGRKLLVADRPVKTKAVGRTRLEIVIGEAQRDASVVVRAAAQDARAEP
jgi:hypothetical protein